MATSRNVVAVTPGGAITREMIVGYVAWFTMPDEDVSVARLRGVWAANGLSPDGLPKGVKPLHVFQRAVRSIEGIRRNGRDTEIKVDEVEDTPNECVYQVTKLVRDHTERLIEHPKAMRVVFKKYPDIPGKDPEIEFNRLGDVPQRELLPYQEAITEFYDRNSTKLPGHKIRSLVRTILTRQLQGENLKGKSGGVYFIPVSGKDTLEGLGEALTDLFKGKAFLHMLPLANDKDQREMVKERHISNSMDEIDELLKKTTAAVRTPRERSVRSDLIENLWTDHQRIKARGEQYAQFLDDTSAELADKLDILKAQIRKLEGMAAA